MLDARKLAAFVQMVDSGSISSASRVLGVAQPALSQQLAALERELGVKLLHRSPAGVAVTPQGQSLYARAQVILRLTRELPAAVKRGESELFGSVPVGLPPSLTVRLGLPLYREIRSGAPGVVLQLVEEGDAALAALMSQGRIDVAVLSQASAVTTHVAVPLYEEALFVVSAPNMMPRKLDGAQLAPLPWVTTRGPHSVRRLFDAAFAELGVEPNIVAEIESLAAVVVAVEAGDALSVLPQSAISSTMHLAMKPLAGLRRKMYFCHRENLSPASRFTVDAARRLWTKEAKRLGRKFGEGSPQDR